MCPTQLIFTSGILNDLFDGSQGSECLLPCVTTHTKTKFLNKYGSERTHIDLTFSSQVMRDVNQLYYRFSGENHNNGYVATYSQYLSFKGPLKIQLYGCVRIYLKCFPSELLV